MRCLSFAGVMIAMLSLDFADALAGSVPSIVLDVRDKFAYCEAPDPCEPPNQPQVNIPQTHQWFWIYVFARNFDNISAIQWAFDWPSTLTVSSGGWLCPPGALGIPEQPPYGPGPIYGSCGSVFNCISSGASQLIGSVGVLPGTGCLEIIESAFPNGTSLVTCSGEVMPIAPANRGKVCVGKGGIITCESAVPVEPATWGKIKAQYGS
jgi:hypothetical protein